ncbi:MAG: hypothetical protein NZT61_03685 [Deltaproteobacteria bacterium]|nr:hypothetical protein [Deltaproteobacteria bacterium]
MVLSQDLDEIALSFSVSQFLFSTLQAEIAKHKVRLHFKLSPDDSSVKKIEPVIEEVLEWGRETVKGNVLFKKDWEKPKTVAGRKAVKLLEWIRKINLDDSFKAQDFFKNFDAIVEKEILVKEMISLCVKHYYAMDNFQRFPSIVDGKEPKESEFVSSVINFLNSLILNFENYFPLDGSVKKALREELAISKCYLRVYANDASVKLCIFSPFTLDKSVVPVEYRRDWNKISVTPYEASTWYCYDFVPDEASLWLSYGLSNPATCWMWRHLGFHPSEARDWVKLGLDPLAARDLVQKGVTPDMYQKNEG